MIYIIIGILFFLSSIVSFFKNPFTKTNTESKIYLLLVTMQIFFWVYAMAFMIIGEINIKRYAILKSKQQEILSLQRGVKEIKELKDISIEQNAVVSGNIDNIYQLKEATKYVSNFEMKKAKYNNMLISLQAKKRNKWYVWFSFYFFVPKQVLDLKIIE